MNFFVLIPKQKMKYINNLSNSILYGYTTASREVTILRDSHQRSMRITRRV